MSREVRKSSAYSGSNLCFLCFKCFFLLLCFSFDAAAGIQTRTFLSQVDKKEVYVAVDFDVAAGGHVSYPSGNGKFLAPRIEFKNAKILQTIWPKPVNVSGDLCYDKNFTVIYSLSLANLPKNEESCDFAENSDIKNFIEYDLSYVVCTDSCTPVHESGVISFNDLLSEKEIEKAKAEAWHQDGFSFALMLLFGFLGGVILNFMPCVLPILSIKIFSILKLAENKDAIRKHALAFASGILSTFLSLGCVLLLLRMSTPGLGWGFFMQEPIFTSCLLTIFLLAAMNFFEAFDFHLPAITRITRCQNLYWQSFFSGVLMAIVSASCVGPFSGIAIGSAIIYGNIFQSACVFAALGSGVAFPFCLMAFSPKITKMFPPQGGWMSKLKTLMGFLMLFSCVWIFWILSSQISTEKVMMVLFSSVAFAMCIWLFGAFRNLKIFQILFIAGICFSGYSIVHSVTNTKNETVSFEAYSDEAFDNARLAKKSILLVFTASWCLNCQYNHLVLNSTEVVELFKKRSVVVFKCDWTSRAANITALLRKFGAAAVPLNVFYAAGEEEPIVLPAIITKKRILELFAK